MQGISRASTRTSCLLNWLLSHSFTRRHFVCLATALSPKEKDLELFFSHGLKAQLHEDAALDERALAAAVEEEPYKKAPRPQPMPVQSEGAPALFFF